MREGWMRFQIDIETFSKAKMV